MNSEQARALNMLIHGMCRSCKLKDCTECMYLVSAVKGDTSLVVQYIARKSR